MAESSDSGKYNDSNLYARNSPLALVVGAAGFLGSHLTEELLRKNIQVIGVDDFSTGVRHNLEQAFKDKNFHFINTDAGNLTLDLPRLDYIFIVTGPSWSLKKVLDQAKKHHSKLVLVSTIELYDLDQEEDLFWIKSAEAEIANFARGNSLNARVVRLAAVYGPRMHFQIKEPIIRLIRATLASRHKEPPVSDFSTRALFVDDAMELIIKSMLSGSTAQKIFDGALLTPIKISEVNQVLLDPVWYETKNFSPTELPPWPTPNLEKTQKILSWEPKTSLVKGLKATVNYFRDNEITIESEKEIKVEPEKKKLIEEFKKGEREELPKASTPKRPIQLSILYKVFAWGVIIYALVLPMVMLAVSTVSYKSNMSAASSALGKGDFANSQKHIDFAKGDLAKVSDFVSFFDFAADVPSIGSALTSTSVFLADLGQVTQGSAHAITATQNLYKGLKAATGELTDPADQYYLLALQEYSLADELTGKVKARMQKEDLKNLPWFLMGGWGSLRERLDSAANLISQGRVVATILPSVIGKGTKKSYLVLFQNNNELRPTGGFIGSYARIDFEGGKLKRLDVEDVYNIDGQLTIHVEPPKEIKEDLGQKDWYLRDSNWESDFPTSARQAQWFYTKETGVRVDGVVALDLKAVEDLLQVVGPLDIADYNEKVTEQNLFATSIAHAEQGFFPGSQAKKNFLTALFNQLFDKLFFLPNQNWPGIVNSLGKSLQQKHFMIYLDDPKLFSYLVSQNWAGIMPRPEEKKEGFTNDFLAVVEANLGANKVNYYVGRDYQLETAIGKEGELAHRLKINYTNKSPSQTWPGGSYKNRLRVYLPFGAKLNRALLDKTDVTASVSSFADYGRSGYSMLVIVDPKQTKSVVLDYTLAQNLSFKAGVANYRLDIIKQSGTDKDFFNWKLTFPINYKLDTKIGQNVGPQEHTIATDLSTDRSFEVKFSK